MFQFLYGAIGGTFEVRRGTFKKSFNSYMVRLVVQISQQIKGRYYCFNSYMVRLVGLACLICSGVNLMFQFLYGAIGGTIFQPRLYTTSTVSIPIWCDWWNPL